jgi:site-specific DNA-adenine methylase
MPISTDRNIFIHESPKLTPVSKKRKLEGVNLSFNGEITQHSTHNLHPYVAAINPPLVGKLLDIYIPTGATILDPFCGGGGVLVESKLKGYKACGFDINPLAVLISKAKTTQISKARIEKAYQRIISDIKSNLGHIEPKISDTAKFWFKENTLPELASLSNSIQQIEEDDLKTLFLVIFSATVRSVMLTYRGEIRLRKLQDKDLAKFQPKTFSIFEQRTLMAMDRISELPKLKTKVELANAMDLPAQDSQFNSVICSPPYADDTNGVGYFQFSRYMLEWLGLEPSGINDHRKRFLGGLKATESFPPSKYLEVVISRVKERSEKHFKDAVSFYWDYYKSLEEMARVTTDHIIIVIGNRVLSRVLFDNARITFELFESLNNIKLIDNYDRAITKKRLPDLGSDGGGISVEHILVFKHK